MAKLDNILIGPETSIFETLKKIDESALEIALVTDASGHLLGTVTDGDIRRAIIRKVSLDVPIEQVMNTKPIVAGHALTNDELMFIMSKHSIKQIPIIDSSGRVINLRLLQELASGKTRSNIAVIMAGGLGKRLGSLTSSTPKPLLPVGDKPILSTIVDQLCRHGITNIFISVNYKADMIKKHFAGFARGDVRISFIEEETFLGTAGALSLLPETPSEPILVMNGDILTTINFSNLFEFHEASNRKMTVCIREFSFEIPYGVVVMQGGQLMRIREKPSKKISINAGIYVLNPEILSLIEKGRVTDMPEVINKACDAGHKVGCYPLSEFWIDIGNPTEYSRARGNYYEHFET